MKRFDGARASEVQSFGVDAVRKMVIGPPHRFDEGQEPEEEIQKMADDIFARGQLQRCSFTEDSAGRVVLTAGRRRRAWVLYINDHPERYEIPAKIVEKYGGWPLECEWGGKATDVQNALVAVAENIKRRAYSPIDLMLAALHFTEHCGMTQEDCVEPLGLNSQSDVSRLLALVPLGRGVHSLVHKGAMRPNQARQLLGLTPEEIAPIVVQIELGAKPAKVLRELKAVHRDGKPQKLTMAELRKKLQANGTVVAFDLLALLDGDPTVNLDNILVEASLRRKGIETRAAEAAA